MNKRRQASTSPQQIPGNAYTKSTEKHHPSLLEKARAGTKQNGSGRRLRWIPSLLAALSFMAAPLLSWARCCRGARVSRLLLLLLLLLMALGRPILDALHIFPVC